MERAASRTPTPLAYQVTLQMTSVTAIRLQVIKVIEKSITRTTLLLTAGVVERLQYHYYYHHHHYIMLSLLPN
jgi:hypothetical protein